MIYILRGPSGCGKSTWAKERYKKGASICSADEYFTRVDGSYHFDPSELGQAHGKCLRRYIDVVKQVYELGDEFDIIVDNTNITDAELAPYVRIAEAYGQLFRIIQFTLLRKDHRNLGVDRYKNNLHILFRNILFEKHITFAEEFKE